MESSFNLTTEDNTIEAQIRDIKNRGVEDKAEEVNDLLKNCNLDGSTIVYNDSEDEVVDEGLVFGSGSGVKANQDNMPDDDVVVNFEDEDGTDDNRAMADGFPLDIMP